MEAFKFPFKAGGFRHELVERVGNVALVKRSKPEHWHYEVVRLRVRAEETVFGKSVPAHEHYPANEDWGTHGFTYRSDELEKARERCRGLLKGGLEAFS